MTKLIFFISIITMGISYSLKANSQELVLMKHNYKIIKHGMFSFCVVDDDQMIKEITFAYSLDLKKKSYTVGFQSEYAKRIKSNDKSFLKEYYGSDVWNQRYSKSFYKKYFTIFDKDFLIWSNSEKLDFFMRVSKKEE